MENQNQNNFFARNFGLIDCAVGFVVWAIWMCGMYDVSFSEAIHYASSIHSLADIMGADPPVLLSGVLLVVLLLVRLANRYR